MNFLYFFAAQVSQVKPGNLPHGNTNNDTIATIMTIVLTILGAVAFLMLVVSGLRFVLSSGEPDKVAQARNGIIYALVGLILAISAQAIVVFVVKQL